MRFNLLFLFMLPISAPASAQEMPERAPHPPATSGVDFGLTAGPNFSELQVEFDDRRRPQYDIVVGYFIGMYTGIRVGLFRLRTGVSFVNAGALFDGSDFLREDEFRVHFITIPIDLRLQVPVGPAAKLYVFAGPQFRYQLELDEIDADLQDDLRHLGTTASLGAGIRLKWPGIPFKISPEIRYAIDVQGLTDGDVSVRDESVRIREEFRADLVQFGLVFGL